jgi:hypothetical protein
MAFLARRPHLDRGTMDLAVAYAQLATCRTYTMGGAGPIPITAVWEWEDRNGIEDPVLRRHVEEVLSAVDGATLRKARAANAPGPDKQATIDKPAKRRRP